ncbi:hypothetical protein [Holdemanella biformis]|uniref:hypothetical protein n=1 Tax=uncultured Holdemanella sp. TaxID=1763549 RepID=UPI00338F1D41
MICIYTIFIHDFINYTKTLFLSKVILFQSIFIKFKIHHHRLYSPIKNKKEDTKSSDT